MNSQFEQALKVASNIGAQQAYNRIRERHGLEKSAAWAGGGAVGASLGALPCWYLSYRLLLHVFIYQS